MCAHRCVNAHTSPAFTLQLCSSCKRLGFREKLFTLNAFLRAILVNDWNAGYRGREMPLAGVGLFVCTLVPGKEQIFVSFGEVAVQTPLSALVH